MKNFTVMQNSSSKNTETSGETEINREHVQVCRYYTILADDFAVR